jgi:hypothetical protein
VNSNILYKTLPIRVALRSDSYNAVVPVSMLSLLKMADDIRPSGSSDVIPLPRW